MCNVQIVKALLMNDTQAEEDLELCSEGIEELLNEAVDDEALHAAVEEYGESLRQIVHSNSSSDVVDSCTGTHWQRFACPPNPPSNLVIPAVPFQTYSPVLKVNSAHTVCSWGQFTGISSRGAAQLLHSLVCCSRQAHIDRRFDMIPSPRQR